MRVALDDATSSRGDDIPVQQLFDAVKIDHALTRDLDRAEGRHRVQSIVDRAHASGQAVVAEGVESAEQLAVLRTLGVRFVQGFHFGEPVALDELGGLLRGSGI